ncbi:MAG: hypothetical protein IPL75_00120, partial [Acidobacteria bacterium]|nr:hypothetical protein [Acidobacteriota bacterium]
NRLKLVDATAMRLAGPAMRPEREHFVRRARDVRIAQPTGTQSRTARAEWGRFEAHRSDRSQQVCSPLPQPPWLSAYSKAGRTPPEADVRTGTGDGDFHGQTPCFASPRNT